MVSQKCYIFLYLTKQPISVGITAILLVDQKRRGKGVTGQQWPQVIYSPSSFHYLNDNGTQPRTIGVLTVHSCCCLSYNRSIASSKVSFSHRETECSLNMYWATRGAHIGLYWQTAHTWGVSSLFHVHCILINSYQTYFLLLETSSPDNLNAQIMIHMVTTPVHITLA